MKPELETRIVGILRSSIDKDELTKIKLSGPVNSDNQAAVTISVRPITIKDSSKLQFVLKYPTQDITKNYSGEDAVELIQAQLQNYHNLSIVTTHHLYQLDKKIGKLHKSGNKNNSSRPQQHDKEKTYLVSPKAPFLKELGISSSSGLVKNSKAKKFKQINKYVEIMDNLISQLNPLKEFNIADIGSGMGYLTFALADHLRQKSGVYQLTGYELRQELVDKGKALAAKSGYANLTFEAKDIFEIEKISADVLIALHACDIATDRAIALGIRSEAQLIVCSPCCHKQVRKAMDKQSQLSSITKHGILKERQAELLTDTIRALVLEYYGYKTSVIEFISNEHTPKNLLIVGIKNKGNKQAGKLKEIKELLITGGISCHHLVNEMKLEL